MGTGDNHARAESAAAGRTHTLGYAGGSLDDAAFVRVQPPSPPSSLGPQEPSLGVVDRWILDRVEGFAWPSADVGRLRSTASSWRKLLDEMGSYRDPGVGPDAHIAWLMDIRALLDEINHQTA